MKRLRLPASGDDGVIRNSDSDGEDAAAVDIMSAMARTHPRDDQVSRQRFVARQRDAVRVRAVAASALGAVATPLR
jgi:hypothetical protein